MAELTEEEIAHWVAQQMQRAPERSEAWGEGIVQEYLEAGTAEAA